MLGDSRTQHESVSQRTSINGEHLLILKSTHVWQVPLEAPRFVVVWRVFSLILAGIVRASGNVRLDCLVLSRNWYWCTVLKAGKDTAYTQANGRCKRAARLESVQS